ncbi:MAG: hypothetical protein WBA18_12090 [Terracidiphilus sp.]
MTRIIRCLMITLLAAPACLLAQTAAFTFDSSQPATGGMGQTTASPIAKANKYSAPAPFSRLALEGGIGIGGINMQAAVEANRYLNIRGIGNYFTYSVNNVKVGGSGSSGADVSGKLNFAEAGIALDYYPWPNHGFRLSPGVTFYNNNGASATGVMAEGSSITLGSIKYYSEAANNMDLNANLGLNTHKQAFTMTTGWGNMISRRGGHWAVPFELGAIFTGVPTVNLNITGYGCTVQSDAAINGESCVNMATNTSAQANLNSQVSKYQSDLNPLKVWPILSIGVSYNFNIH